MSIWNFLERANERWPERVAVRDAGRECSYAVLTMRARSLAAWMCGGGVSAGDRVAVLDVNSTAFLEVTFAAAAAGAVLCPLNVRLAARELSEILERARPRLLFANTRFAELVRGCAYDGRVVWTGPARPATQDGDAGGLAYDSVVRADASATFAPRPPEPDDLAQLYFTSGTTGRPKGVILTHRNIRVHALAAAAEFELTAADRWGHIAPMFHLADAWATFAITHVGGVHVMVPDFEPRSVLAAMAGEGVTVTNLVPTMLQRLLAEAPGVDFDPSGLRLLLSGGAPIAPDVVRRVIENFRCEYAQTYGMTETSPFLLVSLLPESIRSLPEDEQLRYRAKTGRPFPTVELEVVDAEDRPVAPHDEQVGEIRVRGETVSPGYWRSPADTAAAFKDGWLYTGDLATVDGEGFVTIVDRKQDMIVTGGENVYSTEVENALHAHPDVMEAAAFGVPDPDWGESVRAAVVLKPGSRVTDEELLALCAERLAAFKCPRAIERLDDLPKTGSGKVQKSSLRERFALPRP